MEEDTEEDMVDMVVDMVEEPLVMESDTEVRPLSLNRPLTRQKQHITPNILQLPRLPSKRRQLLQLKQLMQPIKYHMHKFTF